MPSLETGAPGRRAGPSTRRRLGAGLLALGLGACGRFGYEIVPGEPGDGLGHGGRDGGGSAGDSSGSGGSGPLLDASAGGAAGASGGGSGGTGEGGAGGAAGAGGALDAGAGGADAGSDASTPLDASPVCSLVPLTLPDWCLEIPELAGPPIIDGVLECPLELRTITPQGWRPATLPDVTAKYAIAWSPSGLYVYFHVTDPVVVAAAAADYAWEGDAVEVYVDADGTYSAPPAFDAVGTRQFIVGAPSSGAAAARGVVYLQGTGASAPWTSSEFAAFLTSDGYVVEAHIVAADLGLATWSPASRAKVGFDLGVDVSYPTAAETGIEGHRLGQFFLHLSPGANREPYFDVAAFCNPTLIAR